MLVTLFHALVLSYALAEEKGKKPEEVPVDLHIRAEWLPLSPSADKPDGGMCSMTRSALRILRTVTPDTGKPYDDSNDVFDCNPADLRRTFRLKKKECLLGEPILVEFRIELNGLGEWREPIGGNYRARGRDDNFLFLMRHEDGTWVRDLYAPIDYYMGGISTSYQVKQNQPQSHWLPVQRWCAISRPGTYELYCFQAAHGHTLVGQREALLAAIPEELKKFHSLDADCVLIDSQTGKRSERYSLIPTWRRDIDRGVSPLTEVIPENVAEYAARSWGVRNTADFAYFNITIKQGSEMERSRMVEHWTKIAESTDEHRMRMGQESAARQAIRFAQQDDFLPLIGKWIAAPADAAPANFYGLAMRPNPEATAMLLKAGTANAIEAMYYLHSARIPDVIPQLIKWLTHEDDRVRAQVETRLCTWTGQAFHRNWQGYHHQRPTLEEGRRMRPMWQEWWEKNKSGFKPITR